MADDIKIEHAVDENGLTSEEYFAQIAEQFGGVAALNERMDRSERAFRRMYRELDTLLEQYPDQWVAMDEDGLVAVADSHDNLLKTLADKGRYASDLATKHLNTQPDEWWLIL